MPRYFHIALLALALLTPTTRAQQTEKNQFDIGLHLLGHGEMRLGGLGVADAEDSPPENKAYFLMERTRLILDYKRTFTRAKDTLLSDAVQRNAYLQMKVNAQHMAIWGQKGGGGFSLYEAWAKLNTRIGLFAQIGRQALAYDDERIIGPDDWAMASLSHDVLRLGYEGHGHKAHIILGFNQNPENLNGGTYYTDGYQPYKSLITAWYHYDLPKTPLGASLLFMNIGMQGGRPGGFNSYEPATRYQQLAGAFVSYRPGNLVTEASYYRQFGRNEENVKIDAWMASIKAAYQFNHQWGAVTGFDYLSGDELFAVPPKGGLGLIQHNVIKGFNPIYGSHHKFYGMMDFFYVTTYVNGFTPGLQNLYAGVNYSPIPALKLHLSYHYMALATHLRDMNMTLGHDIDFEASYQIVSDVNLGVGFSYMVGTETMERLKRAATDNNLKWAWFSLVVSPRVFSHKW